MPMIPARIYHAVERRLHAYECDVEEATEQLRLARAAAMDVHAPAIDPNGGGHGSTRTDKLERNLIAMDEAADKVRIAMLWRGVIDAAVAHLDEAEQKMARLLYREHLPQQAVAEQLFMDRQTVRRFRDHLVLLVALGAAEAGLITVFAEVGHGRQADR